MSPIRGNDTDPDLKDEKEQLKELGMGKNILGMRNSMCEGLVPEGA